MSLLDVQDLHIEFPSRLGTFQAVKGVSFQVEKGEILGLVGESGAGKSTIGNGVIDLLQPPGRVSQGNIIFNGQDIGHLSGEAIRKLRGRKIGYIFQDPMTALNPLFTIEQQMVEALVCDGTMSMGEAKARSLAMLESVGIKQAENRLKQYPHQLSGGMLQRVVIAIALICKPDLIIADEPTTALDVSIQDQILNLIREQCKSHDVACILVTHDMGVIASTCDRVAVLYHGELMEVGETNALLENPQHNYTKSLIAAVPRADVKLHRFPNVSYIEKSEALEPIDVKSHWLGQRQEYGKIDDGNLLKLENINLSFETKPAFLKKNREYVQAAKSINFEIREGETFGLVGESGSGKSTIARMIAGLYTPDSGCINYAGFDLHKSKSKQERAMLRQEIQMIFQNPYSSMNPRMRIFDIIAEPMRFHKLTENEQQTRQVVNDLLDHVGLGRAAGIKFPHEFSGGQRQRISVARCLATRPRLLICDEPTSALDVSVQAQILNLLKDLQEELNLTMLFISHDLPVIRQMCDRVGVLRFGELLEVGDTEQVYDKPNHEYTASLIQLMPSLDHLSRAGLDIIS